MSSQTQNDEFLDVALHLSYEERVALADKLRSSLHQSEESEPEEKKAAETLDAFVAGAAP